MDDDNQRYMRWLEEMWDAHKFDPHRGTGREERRTEEVLEMFKELGELSKREVESPELPPRGEV